MAKVLIIDDDVNLARLLQTHLTDEGYEVSVVHRGADGMTEVLKQAPDLIMLDVILPDVTGFQMCSQFRKTASTKQVPIIMMTCAARFPNQQQYAIERGANEYLLKPFGVTEIGALINSYIGKLRKNPIAAPVVDLSQPNPSAAAIPSQEPLPPVPRDGSLTELRSYLIQALSSAHQKGI